MSSARLICGENMEPACVADERVFKPLRGQEAAEDLLLAWVLGFFLLLFLCFLLHEGIGLEQIHFLSNLL